ncbi:alanine racemase [Echinicola sp. 20G]|uniref:alanine racemase n=1 Tax=Echinicola sp. 20G TaxID=2781961 RepID=UPI00351C4A41
MKMHSFSVTSPTLLINEGICRQNLRKMSEKAKKHGLELIPHFKTHQSLKVGEWCRSYDIQEITVSSINMASYFAPQNWQNIHIAFPFNPREIHQLNELSEKHSLSVQLVNEELTALLAEKLNYRVGFFIEIDAGYGRTGVEVSDFGLIEKIMRKAKTNPNLQFKGFYIHAGHTYHATLNGIEEIHQQTKAALHMLKDKYITEFPDLVTRSGDTPSCSLMDDFEGIDQIGPGNFVFYDLTQANIGSCEKEDIAVALAAPIVDIKKSKGEILLHAGGVHLSKDVLTQINGKKNFGEIVLLTKGGWSIPSKTSYLKSISQEHGIVQADAALMNNVKVGDVLGILPIHSCMTADCMGSYMTLSGELVDHLKGNPNNR